MRHLFPCGIDNPDTHWETRTNNTEDFTNEVIFTLDKPEVLNRIAFLARDNRKGFPEKFEIYASETTKGDTFQLVATGSAQSTNDFLEFKFQPTKFKRIKFKFVKAYIDSEVTDLTPFFGTGGSLNYIGYSDADMDTLLTAARTAVGEGQTLLAYSSLQKKLAEELPYISIAYRNQAVFASKNIGGEVHPVESNVFRGIEAWTYQKGE